MASKRRVRRQSCEGKLRYPTQDEARMASNRANSRTSWIMPYKCNFCGGYHIGHAPNGVRQSVIARQKNKI